MSDTEIAAINGFDLVKLGRDRLLTAAEFQRLSDVPPEEEWFANIGNPNTRRAYRNDVKEFMAFAGIEQAEDFRLVKRAHLIAWRKQIERRVVGPDRAPRVPAPSTIRRKLSALGSLFEHLCECNAVPFNPVDGVTRPRAGANEGKSPALGDDQAKAILDSPPLSTLKGLRDRAILSVLLFQGLRRAELCSLSVGDVQARRGVQHFRVLGKGGKIRYVPIHPQTLERITDYLELSGHGGDIASPLFKSVSNSRNATGAKPLSGSAVYRNVVKKYALKIGVSPSAISVHGLRATAATNALDHDADISKVQEWLGHSNISTTRLYDRRKMKPEDSPTFKISY